MTGFTKAILLDKQGVEFEVVGKEKQPAPKLVVKEKKNEDFAAEVAAQMK